MKPTFGALVARISLGAAISLAACPGKELHTTTVSPAKSPARGDTVSLAKASLAKALASVEGGEISFTLKDGPAETRVLVASKAGAYPGAGIRSVVIFEGASYGRHGERPLAHMVRAQKWLVLPPTADELTSLVIAARLDSSKVRDSKDPAPSMTLSKDKLVLTFIARLPLNRDASEVVYTVTSNADGAEELVQTNWPAEPDATAGTATTLGERLDAAVRDEDPMAIKRIVYLIDDSALPDRLALLARATLYDNANVVMAALGAMGKSTAAIEALKKAWAPLDATRLKKLRQAAKELHGAAFAGQL